MGANTGKMALLNAQTPTVSVRRFLATSDISCPDRNGESSIDGRTKGNLLGWVDTYTIMSSERLTASDKVVRN